MNMTLFPQKLWLDSPILLAIRIAQIIGYSDVCPPFQNSNGTWVLNTTNDWWLDIHEDKCELRYRYTYEENEWDALQQVIQMFIR